MSARARGIGKHLRRHAPVYVVGILVFTFSPLPSMAAAALVTTNQIANGAVTNAKLATGSVGSAKILDGTITTTDIKNGTIKTSDLAGTEKTLYAEHDFSFVDSLVNPGSGPEAAKTLLKIVVQAPAPGTVEVRLDAQTWIDFPSTTDSVIGNSLLIARCNAPNTLEDAACDGVLDFYFSKPANQSGTDSTFPYSMSALVTVGESGTATLYLNSDTAYYPAGLYAENFAHVQAAYTPSNPIPRGSSFTVTASKS